VTSGTGQRRTLERSPLDATQRPSGEKATLWSAAEGPEEEVGLASGDPSDAHDAILAGGGDESLRGIQGHGAAARAVEDPRRGLAVEAQPHELVGLLEDPRPKELPSLRVELEVPKEERHGLRPEGRRGNLNAV